ncbi:antigen-presenting glycoprotein CD1d-like, partial [Carlito syrichta]|uniref:Antigen-presenting glycoprotein CD1d-like n=1 Tax=Carlito syrichta TaxID=1868482 RepID=A0A1U7TK88_CARSF
MLGVKRERSKSTYGNEDQPEYNPERQEAWKLAGESAARAGGRLCPGLGVGLEAGHRGRELSGRERSAGQSAGLRGAPRAASAMSALPFLLLWALPQAWGTSGVGDAAVYFGGYRSSFTRDIKDFAKMLQVAYPIELQLSAGCEIHPGNTSENFLHVAYEGREVVSFQETSWKAAPEAPDWINVAITVLNQDQETRETVQWLLNDTCPQFASGLLEAGKSELEKQVKPKAWLSSGPGPGPGRLLLVCHVSGFYPKPVWVMWMRGEQEQSGTQQGDILPNADETWYLQATLDVETGDAPGLACRVNHSSLEGQDIILYWGGSHASVGLIALAVLTCLVSLLALIIGLAWFKKRR